MDFLDHAFLIPIRCYTSCLSNNPLLQETVFAFYDLVSILKIYLFLFFPGLLDLAVDTGLLCQLHHHN